MNRLDQTFARLRTDGELGLFPYMTVGYPDPAVCSRLLDAIAEAGADGIELGVPFSDPLADGATIQRAGAAALEQGASLRMALDLARDFRTRHDTPLVVMSYFNPLLAHGLTALARDAAAAGIDGFIVPDLPPEEAEPFRATCAAHGLDLVQFVAPTSTDVRIEQAARMAGGFIYCIALLGVTGARSRLSDELPAFLRRVRAGATQPLVVGFGISRPEHVRGLTGLADGVIVASALIDLIDRTAPAERSEAVTRYLREMKAATRPPVSSGAG